MAGYTVVPCYSCDECKKEYKDIDEVLECCDEKQKLVNILIKRIKEKQIKSGANLYFLQMGDVMSVISTFFKEYSISKDGGKDG